MSTYVHARTRAHPLLRLAVVLLLALGMAPALGGAPAAAATSSLSINSHSCPYGTDVENLSVYDLAAACQGQLALNYTITGPGYSQDVNTAGGLYMASNLDAGAYTVTQGFYDSAYVGPPVAFCNVHDQNGADVAVAVPTSVRPNAESPIELTVDGYAAFCDVFNAEGSPPATPSTDANVSILKWDCPEGTTSTDFLDLQAACTTGMEGVTFTIRDFADNAQSDDTGGQPATASFDGWKVGGATIAETIPQDYGEPVVFCQAGDDNGITIPGYDLTAYPASSGQINVDIPPAPGGGLVTFSCDWYNLPTTTATTTDAEVFISKWECPAGYDSTDYASLQQDCDHELEGIDFTAVSAGGETKTDDTGGQPARAAFTPWYNGNSTFTESIPDGYGVPVVFCYATDDAGDPIAGYEASGIPVTDGTILVTIPTDPGGGIVSYSCDWYNIPTTPTSAGIYIHKYGCPQGSGSSADFSQLASSCSALVRGATFDVSGPDGYADTQALSDVDVSWENLAPGDYNVTESAPSGYRDSKVACAVGSYEQGGDIGDYEEADVTSGGIDFTLQGGRYLDCVWYNIPPPPSGATTTPTTTRPAGPATLVLVTSTCKADYDVYAPKADPTKDCKKTTDGVSFTLRGGRNSSLTKVTGDDDPGTATFANLPAGGYLLQETYPDGVASAFVWDCTSTVRTFAYPFAPFAWIGPDGQTKINVVPGETLTCRWYDVPRPTSTTGGDDNVSIAVLDCPGDLANQSSCDPAADGVAVDLTAAGGGADAALKTDKDGVAAGPVQPGSYDIEVDGGICFADSDAFADDGTLEVGDDPVDVTVYRCGSE